MFKTALLALVAFISLTLIAAPAPSLAAAMGGNDIRLRADLVGKTTAVGHADYREFQKDGQTVRRITVEVQHAKPGSIWGIRHNGVVVGIVKVNNLGIGKFDRQTITDDPGEQGAVPAMKAGDKITVGPGVLTGILKSI